MGQITGLTKDQHKGLRTRRPRRQNTGSPSVRSSALLTSATSVRVATLNCTVARAMRETVVDSATAGPGSHCHRAVVSPKHCARKHVCCASLHSARGSSTHVLLISMRSVLRLRAPPPAPCTTPSAESALRTRCPPCFVSPPPFPRSRRCRAAGPGAPCSPPPGRARPARQRTALRTASRAAGARPVITLEVVWPGIARR